MIVRSKKHPMRCVMPTLLPRLAANSGLAADRLGQMADAARRMPLPLDPAVVDAVLAGLPASHDPQQGAAALQAVAQGLRLALRQSRDRLPAPRVIALLTAMTGTILPDAPAPDPQLVQAIRADLCLRPAPLPLELPTAPDAQRRAVLAAAPMVPWPDDETGRIAHSPTFAGLAWALGVRHPRIRTVVDESLEAGVAAIREGVTDSGLLQRVATNDLSGHWVMQVLAVRPDLRGQRAILDHVRHNREVAHAMADAVGPCPALWDALPVPLPNEIAVHYRMTPTERAWPAELAIRTPPGWTEADDHLAARFLWHAVLRASLSTEGMESAIPCAGGTWCRVVS